MLHVFTRPLAAVVCRRSLVGVVIVTCSAAAHAEQISLDAAVQRAITAHPDLGLAAADVSIGEGNLVTAKTRPFNPELAFTATPLRVGGLTLTDYEVSLGQVFELGGKRAHRAEVAEGDLAAARSRHDWTRRTVVLRVRRAYYMAAIARAIVQTATDAQRAADEARAATEERLNQKAGTQLEVNVASADAGRAKRALLDAERAYTAARAELGAAIGAKPEEDLEPIDEAPPPAEPRLDEDTLVARALSARSDLQAIRHERDAAKAGVDLAAADAIPNVGVSVGFTREREPDLTFDMFSIGLSIPIPLFDRKQGERAVARATLRKAVVEEKASRWQAERDIRTAFRSYRKAREAVLAFDLDVVGKLDENLKLAKESFQTGKIGLLEFNVVRRSLVDTRTSYLEARREAVDAQIALELAAGDVEVFR